MNIRKFIFQLLILSFLSGCSSFSWEKFLYDVNQSVQKEQCRKDPISSCPKFESYEIYNKKRNELESKKDHIPLPTITTD
ncbi:MAG: hypothetical protein HOJ79_08315 [Nitrospina sp.]|jgi:hypothetical protein|nr:hypothetical protein [Nitrospina sp.]